MQIKKIQNTALVMSLKLTSAKLITNKAIAAIEIIFTGFI